MTGLPPLIPEDVQLFEEALDDLLLRSEAAVALIIDKGGPLISQRGAMENIDTTTVAALAAGTFCATQAIAQRIGEAGFSHIYQQGERHSLLFCDIDENLLLIVIFKANISAGAVRHFSAATVGRVGRQLLKARQRSPQESMDLVSMDVADVSSIFTKKPRA
jgi:predicted regulator of Ras-like GTPase activity (Roadblock/LC7/MglB family)